MKLKLQNGGVSPYLSFANNSNDEGSFDDILKQPENTENNARELLADAKMEGLNSDLIGLRQEAEQLVRYGGMPGASPQKLNALYVNLYYNIEKAKNNKKEYEEAYSIIDEKNAWNDPVLNGQGQLYIISENGLEFVNLSEYDPSTQRAATYKDLLSYRQHQVPGGQLGDMLLNDIASGIGRQDLRKRMSEIIRNFKTDSHKESYTTKTKAEIEGTELGFEYITGKLSQEKRSGLGVGDLEKGYNMAMMELLGNLTPKEKSYLNIMASQDGLDVQDVIHSMLNVYTEQSYSIDRQQGGVGSSGSGSGKNGGSGSNKTVDIGWHTSTATGETGLPNKKIQYNFGDPNNPFSMVVNGSYHGPAQQLDGKGLVGTGTLREVFNAGGLASIADPSNVYFGEDHVEDVQLDNIVYNGQAVHRAELPIVADRSRRAKPDFELLAEYNEMDKEVDEMIQANYTENEIKDYVEQDGNFKYINGNITYAGPTAPFMILDGYSHSDNVDKESNRLVSKVDKDIGKVAKSFSENSGLNSKGRKTYQGPIFISIPAEAASLSITHQKDMQAPETWTNLQNITANNNRPRPVAGTTAEIQ